MKKLMEKIDFASQPEPPLEIKIGMLTSGERESILKPSLVVKTLKIKPGMNILDIGAGTGLFTFLFADELRGTGKVFATETDQDMVKIISQKIKKGNYRNITPLLFESEKEEISFYKQQTFDIIFLSESYQDVFPPEDYFHELRTSLSKDGRLYIINFKNVSDFSEFEFGDFRKVVEILASNGENFPIFKRLSSAVRGFIKNWEKKSLEIPPEIQNGFIRDINNMLSDRFLLYDLLTHYKVRWYAQFSSILPIMNIRLANWLYVNLDENGVFDKKTKNLNSIDKKYLHLLNRLVLEGVFETARLLQLKGPPIIFPEKKSIISKMSSAGYKFVREYDLLTQYYFLEFKVKDRV